jgi:thiol-disulfide isomerase/thioredoxin
MRKKGILHSHAGAWQLWILGAFVLLLACRLPESVIGALRRPTAAQPPTATITPVRVNTDTPRAAKATKTASSEAPAPTASPVDSPAAPVVTAAVTETEAAPQTTPEATADEPPLVPTDTPAGGAAETPEAYPPAQAPTAPTAYPGAATDVPAFNPYPGGTTPTPAVQASPTPDFGSLPTDAAAASATAEPLPSPPGTQITRFVSPLPTRPAQTGAPLPTLTRTPFSLPTPTPTSTATATRTSLPAPPWVNARIVATDPKTVALAAGKPQLVEFFAFWSGPSLALAPIVQGVEREFAGRVIFTYLDIDDPAVRPFMQQLFFRYEPHFFLLDGQGKVLRQWLGNVTADELRRALDEALR